MKLDIHELSLHTPFLLFHRSYIVARPKLRENVHDTHGDKGVVSRIFKNKLSIKKVNQIKRAKDLNRHFTKEDIQMADKHKGSHYSSGK